MKKLLTLTGLALCVTFGVQAQNTVRLGGGGLAYEKGDKIIQVGLGLGRAIGGYNLAYRGLGGSLNAAFEVGIHEYFSVGAYGAVGRYSYNIGRIVIGDNREYTLTAVAVGARGSFHYLSLLNEAFDANIDEEKIDLYVSLLLGLEFFSDVSGDIPGYNATVFDGGAVLGGRYKFSPRLAVFSELGYASLSVWTLGISFHL